MPDSDVSFKELFLAVVLAETIQGWTNRAELAYLYSEASKVPINQHVVEIGAWRGRSTVALALGRAQVEAACSVVTVEHFLGNQEHQPVTCDLKAEFLVNMERCGIRYELIEGRSTMVGLAWPRAPIGLLFIDGSHEYEDVCADIRAWEPHVILGGIIVVHDYFGEWEGVTRAVDELLGHYQQLPSVGCMWAGRKVKVKIWR